ncbi:MAG: hypothetical protein RIR26_2887, partial [Pseudomonadota bacterium]
GSLVGSEMCIRDRICSSSRIHKSATIEGDVSIDSEVEIMAGVYLKGPLIIGRGTKIFPNCVIGTDGEHRSKSSEGKIIIGENNVIRELTVIQRGTGNRDTSIGNNCFIMDHTHIAHDVKIESGVTIAPNVVLGGHVYVQESATIGIGSVFHQWSTIGAFSMTGMGSVVTKDIPPLAMVMGNPAKYAGPNIHALNRLNIPLETLVLGQDGYLHAENEQKLLEWNKAMENLRKRKLCTIG